MKRLSFAILLLGLIFPALSSRAAIVPNGLFTSGAVFQQGVKIPIWGTASPGERVRVRFGKQDLTTATDRSGKWKLALAPMQAGGPFTIEISGSNAITLKEIYVGEVFLCGGQSNMELPLSLSKESQTDISSSTDPKLRLYVVPHTISETLNPTLRGSWEGANSNSVRSFSALAYYFGRSLRKALHVPVGLIQATWGGSPAQAWTSRKALESSPLLKEYEDRFEVAKLAYAKELESYPALREKRVKEVEDAKIEKKPAPPAPKIPIDPATSPRSPGVLYSNMIAPLIPYGIRGCIWHQGESNAGDPSLYRTLFSTMISSWRSEWRIGDFPFLFVQLAPFLKKEINPSDSLLAEIREAQLQISNTMNNVGMAVSTDIGEEKEILSRIKQPVGERLALLARKMIYRQSVEDSGPRYSNVAFKDGKSLLSFGRAETGLESRGGMLNGFTIAGEDKVFFNAEARIEGAQVVVSSSKVPKPVAVRYGWANFPVGNLWNGAGLPASTFRTDDFELPKRVKSR